MQNFGGGVISAWTQVGEFESQPSGLFPDPIFLVCLALDYPDGRLSPQDIVEELLRLGLVGRVAGIAYTANRLEGGRNARVFLRESGKLFSTALVNTQLPGSRAARQVQVLAREYAGASVKDAINSLSAEALHRRFHEEISKWFLSTSQSRNELRHLIRVLFLWLLQERCIIPDDALWRPGINWRALTDGYVHEHILWLFDALLAKPKESRPTGDDPWSERLRATVPFLNGSMFTRLADEDLPELLSNAQYLDRDSGLLSILGRYDWTLSDRTGYATESAIDASMLGELFERLVLVTDGPRIEPGDHMKMPGGTYYTPQDIADEMVVDALSGWTEHRIQQGVALHDLFHPAPNSNDWTDLSPIQASQAYQAIKEVTVLDPCCGSGAFTVAVLQALWRARTRLAVGDTESAEILESIVEKQLFAVDIHPLAVLITRLRLFIALVDMRPSKARPLPNLETRIVAANTLCVNVGGTVSVEVPEITTLIDDLGAAREAWTSAHLPDEKSAVLQWDRRIRRSIKDQMQGWESESRLKWLGVDLLYPAAPSAGIDIRWLFPKPEGWDIVVGNPPYQSPDRSDKELGQRMGYLGAATNLYLMFIEAALEVARPGGCVNLIMPHSIVFGRAPRSFMKVRTRIESMSRRIDIRTYDNGPQPAFPKLPWLKQGSGKTNRQRVTIVRILLGEIPSCSHTSAVYSRGLLRLTASNRLEVLRGRPTPQLQHKTDRQWTQAPSRELLRLLDVMRGARCSPDQGLKITLPQTAMYFITCLPLDRLRNPSRKTIFLADDEYYWPMIGLYNSHLFYAYWLMMGDHFHLTTSEYGSVRPPDGWKDRNLLGEITSIVQRLASPKVIQLCRKDHIGKGGKRFPNCDFHSQPEGRRLIRQLDELLLRAYGLNIEPLLTQMQTIRIGSAHELEFIT